MNLSSAPMRRPMHWGRSAKQAMASLLLMASVPFGALAQGDDAASGKKEADRLDTVEVTGSRIKRVQVEGPTPVAIITRDQIDRLGYTTVKDVLGNLSYNSGGTFDAGQSFSFARGTQSIDLRGFGSGRTLVLLDGRRLPVFPQGLGGTNAFVDLSAIPASLVERVEILLDGASAIYGSDAISGVINIITRKNIEGSEVSARVSGTQDGGASAQRYQFLQGFSTPNGTSVQLLGEFTKQNVLRFTDRDYSNSDFANGGSGSSFGSSFLTDSGAIIADPACGTPGDSLGGLGVATASFCRFDRSKFRQWIPESEKGSLYLRLDRKMGELDTFARFGIYRGEQSVQLEPNPFSGGESAAFTANRIFPLSAFPIDPTFNGNAPGYVPSGASNDPDPADGEGGYFFRRLVEFGPRGQDMTTESYNGLLGVAGQFGVFNWEVGLARNEVRLTNIIPTVLSSVLDNEVSNNGLDMFGVIPADVLAKAKHVQTEIGVSRSTAVDATLSGPAGFQLKGGAAQFAAHADYVTEKYSDVFDAISSNGDVFDGGNGGGGSRELTGLGFELNLPILDVLEVGLAGRYDDYHDASDTGGAFSPSIKVAYRPIESLLLRASAGESFRAPDLQRLFGATTAGFETVVDSPACTTAGGSPGTAVDPSNPNDPCLPIQSVPSIVGSNPNLKEEEGRNFNLGVSWEAMDKLNITVDYFRIKVEDLVSALGAQQILDLCASTGAFCSNVQRAPDGTLGTPSAGGSSQALIRSGAVNLAKQDASGYDVSAGYEFDLGGIGRFKTELSWSHLISVKVVSEPGGPEIQQLKNFDTVILPQDRQNLTADWTLSQFGATLRVDRVGKFPGGQPGLTVEKHEFVKPFTTVNLQGRVDFGGLGTVRVGVDNILDEGFSLDPTFVPGTPGVQNQFLGEGTSFYSNPLGRVGYLQYEYKF